MAVEPQHSAEKEEYLATVVQDGVTAPNLPFALHKDTLPSQIYYPSTGYSEADAPSKESSAESVTNTTSSNSSGEKTFFHKVNFTPGGYGIVNRLILV